MMFIISYQKFRIRFTFKKYYHSIKLSVVNYNKLWKIYSTLKNTAVLLHVRSAKSLEKAWNFQQFHPALPAGHALLSNQNNSFISINHSYLVTLPTLQSTLLHHTLKAKRNTIWTDYNSTRRSRMDGNHQKQNIQIQQTNHQNSPLLPGIESC